MTEEREGSKQSHFHGQYSRKMDIHDAARAGDLSALQDAIKRGDDVNSVDEVIISWFVGICKAEGVKVCFCYLSLMLIYILNQLFPMQS